MSDFADIDYIELLINGASKHGKSKAEFTNDKSADEWNEINKGAGLRANSVDDDVISYLQAGFYDNSINQNTIYAGGGIKKRFGTDIYADFGVEGNLLIGGYDSPVIPMVAPTVTIGKENLGSIELKYVPETDIAPSVTTLNLAIPFK